MNEFVSLNDEELKLKDKAVEIINSSITVPCTGCAYCVDECPINIPIPKYFSLYNAENQEFLEKEFVENGVKFIKHLNMTDYQNR